MLPTQFQKLIDELLEKSSRGACSPQEEQFLQDWYNNIGDSENIRFNKETKAVIEERLWAAINPKKPNNIKRWMKAAAIISIPLLVCFGFYFNRQSLFSYIASSRNEAPASGSTLTRVINENITVREITLSDGSTVILQPLSEIHFSKDFAKNDIREVHLKGEAFFKVKRDSLLPFMVYANEVVTKVLGTSFNIRAYENADEIIVAVKTGKVCVYARSEYGAKNNIADSNEVILTPNQQMVYNRNREEASKQLAEKPEIILPNSNLFKMQFENVEVNKIFQVLEENYGIEINYDENTLKACKLTTSMSDEGLYERIEVICKAIGASYSVKDAVITIKSNGC